ncbi:MAG TPA: PAS domain S-box protein [Methanospirillum sp.]|nr:PAS domain S-box protein [Methanospirillum sp.]
MVLILVICLFFVSFIVWYTYSVTSTQIQEAYTQQQNGSEEYLINAASLITSGEKLWESTYRDNVQDVMTLFLADYEKNNRDASQMNLSHIISQVNPKDRDRIDLMIINKSGIAEFTTSKSELYLDFSKWEPFYVKVEEMRKTEYFYFDRVIKGFDPNQPQRTFGYQATPDHEYLFEVIYKVYEDNSQERSLLSNTEQASKIKSLNPSIKKVHIFGSTGGIIIGKSDYPGGVLDKKTKKIVDSIFKTQLPISMIDPINQTETHYFFISSNDNTSPSAQYMDRVAMITYSRSGLEHNLKNSLLLATLILVVALISILLVALIVSRRFISPVDHLVEDLEKIGSGDLSHPIRPLFHQELNRIAHAVTVMVHRIQSTIDELESSEIRFRSLFMAAGDGILLFDGTFILEINPEAYTVLGWDPQIPGPYSISSLPGPLIPVLEEYNPCTGPIQSEVTLLDDKGNSSIINIWLRPVELKDQILTHVHLRDVTKQRQACRAFAEQEALKESHQQIQNILTLLPDPTFVINHEGKVLFWNNAMERMSGVRSNEMIGKNQYEYALPFYHKIRPCLIDIAQKPSLISLDLYDSIKKQGDVLITDQWLTLKNGSRKYVSIYASPLNDIHNNPIGAIEAIRDITDIKRSEEALQVALKKVNLLTNITRHDIKNQIVVLRGAVYLLDNQASQEEIIESITMLKKGIEKILAQIEFTRFYEELGIHEPNWLDPSLLFTNALDESGVESINLINHLSGIEILADPLLGRVFYTLIDNAQRHGENVSEITGSWFRKGLDLIIRITDNGCGIPDQIKERIFERGFGENTGFGLFLSREILETTGMSIKETGKEGHGAQFDIIIPNGRYSIIDE